MGFGSRGRGVVPRHGARWVMALAAAGLVAAVVTPSNVKSVGRLTDDAIAVWQHQSPGGDWDVFYSVMGSDSFASLEWAALPGPQVDAVAALAGDDENPSVAMNPQGGAIAVWQHDTSDLDLERDIYYAAFDPSEPTGWTAAAPLAALTGDDTDPAIAFGADGKAIAVWVREDGGGTRIAYATYSGGAWTFGGLVGTSGFNGAAAIPEITFTNRASVASPITAQRAVAAWSDSDGLGGRRLYFSEWIGLDWLDIDPVSVNPAQDFDVPGDRESQIGLAADGSGDVKLVWSGAPASSPGVVAATWDGATWAADVTIFGNTLLAEVRAHSPCVATDPENNILSMYSLDGFLEFSTDAGAFYTPEAFAQDSAAAEDLRPVAAAVRDRFVSVFWGNGGTTAPSEIYWTSYRADTGEWTTASPIADLPGLEGEDRYPDISSFISTSGPTLLSVHPNHGPVGGGTGVFLGGYRFASGGPVTVTFGGVPATNVLVIDDNTVVCNTPAGTGLVDVVVTNDQGPSTLADAFSYDPAPIVNVVTPAFGPEFGGTNVTILGSFFEARDEVVAVDFDGVSATNVVLVNDSTITCTTPAGTGLADVTVTNLDGAGTLVDGFRYLGDEILCRTGNVNAGVGPIADVLFINGSAGSDPDRIVTVAQGAPILVELIRPPAKPSGTSRFTMYVYPKKVPTLATVTQQARAGHDLGMGCMPTPLSLGSPQPAFIFNNIGHNPLLGTPNKPSTPAPSTLLNLPNGVNKVIDVTFMGFILDPGSANTDPASITNTIVLRIQ